jgi:hypothetical protein
MELQRDNDVVILGGGPVGVIAAGVLSELRPQWRVVLVEPGPLAASLDAGGLRYLRGSQPLQELVRALGVPFAAVPVRGGVLMPNQTVANYPDEFEGEQLAEIQRKHYCRTRGTLDGFTADVMNFGGTPVPKLELDRALLVARATARTKVVKFAVTDIDEDGQVLLRNGFTVRAKRFVLSTIPLPGYAKLAATMRDNQPVCHNRWLVVGRHPTAPESFQRYDYIYTPWLSGTHRLSRDKDGAWWSETSRGNRDAAEAVASFMDQGKVLPGHLLHVDWNGGRLPPRHHLLGRFAAWEPRYTVDQTVQRVQALVESA